jgi:hypothetical protein
MMHSGRRDVREANERRTIRCWRELLLWWWSRMGWFRHVHVFVLTCRCFEVPTRAGSTTANHIHRPVSARLRLLCSEPCDGLSALPHTATTLFKTARPNPMPIATSLHHTLLHPSPPARTLAFIPTIFALSRARTMATKPSLAAAEDFLSFVNASPTRMLPT